MRNVKKNDGWYVVYTYPNFEKRLHCLISKLNVDSYLPLRTEYRQWSDRRKKLTVPLFRNYLFVRANSCESWRILSLPGVVKFLSFDGKLAVVSDTEINMIRRILSTDVDVAIENTLEVGDQIEIIRGPLHGFEGILSEKKGERRLIINLKTLDKAVSIDVSTFELSMVETDASNVRLVMEREVGAIHRQPFETSGAVTGVI